MFEVFEHTADLGLRVEAATKEELFAEAQRGMTSLLVANPDAIGGVQEKQLRVEGDEDDYLLFDWLNELLYLFETERLVCSACEISCRSGSVVAHCKGEEWNPERHGTGYEVKAITYHGLRVWQAGGRWHAEVIVDI
jgi:SHS2 domain-containing protein